MGKAVGQITITDLNDPIISGTAPSNPKPGQLWLNTSVTPNELLAWENGTWKTVRAQPKPGSVGNTELQNGAVTSTKIQDNAITSTKITGGAITTPKLATNAVTADKIAAGAVTASKIEAGAITTDKLDVLAKSLVNNYSVTGDTKGWSPKPVLSVASELGNTKFHLMENIVNIQVLSDSFEVNPTTTYKVSISVRVPSTIGTRYFGMYCYDSANNLIAVTPVYPVSNTAGTATTNPYFWIRYGAVNSWLDIETYILGCNTSNYGIPETKNASACFRLPKNAHHVRLRYLNYPNNQGVADAYWWGPSVTPVDAGEIQAERIRTGLLQALNNASWLNLNDGKFSFGNGAMKWDGSLLEVNGELKSVIGDRTAIIRNGQFMIFKGANEMFNLTNFVDDGTEVYFVLGSTAKKLIFAKTDTPGSVTQHFGGIQVYPLKLYFTTPAEFNTVNTYYSVSSYQIQGNTVMDRRTGGFHIGVRNNYYTYVEGSRYGGFSAAYDNYLTLGRSDYRWMSLWVVSGVVQTSGKKDKEKIHKLKKKPHKWKPSEMDEGSIDTSPPELCFEEDVYELLDTVADSLCTFRYKGQEGEEALQLGVIADDIDHLAAYPFIGTKVVIPAKPAVEAKPEVLEVRDRNGNIVREYEPAVEAKEAVPEQTVHGLNPLPVAMLAIAGYRKLRAEVEELKERISRIENLPSIKNKL